MKTAIMTVVGLLAAAVGSVYAAPTVGLTYASTCEISDFPTVVGNQSCVNEPLGSGTFPPYSIPQNPIARATTAISASVTGYALSVSATGKAYGTGISNEYGTYTTPYFASSQGIYSNYLTTSGPMRQGLLVASISYAGTQSTGEGDFSGSNLYLGVLSGTYLSSGIICGEGYLHGTCDSTIGALNYFNRTNGGLTVQLGAPFELTYTATSRSSAGGGGADYYYGETSLNEQISFAFFELDGTPVEVLSAAPEPSTLGLMALPLLGFVARGKRKKVG